jgi:hypothetical protein
LPWEEQKKLIVALQGPDRVVALDRLFRANTALILKVGIDISRSWYRRYCTDVNFDDVLSSLIHRFIRIADRVDIERGRLSTLFVCNAFQDLFTDVFRYDSAYSVTQRFGRLSVEDMNRFFTGEYNDSGELGFAADKEEYDPSAICEERDLLSTIKAVLGTLSEEDRRIVGTYWGEETMVQYMESTGLGRTAATAKRMRAMGRLCERLATRLDLPASQVTASVHRMINPQRYRKLQVAEEE